MNEEISKICICLLVDNHYGIGEILLCYPTRRRRSDESNRGRLNSHLGRSPRPLPTVGTSRLGWQCSSALAEDLGRSIISSLALYLKQWRGQFHDLEGRYTPCYKGLVRSRVFDGVRPTQDHPGFSPEKNPV
ncbi:H(+)-ATPase 2 [Striga asiatica]|uniref:H(+)-ATPase 2 n=1 Tax=Striga asiatica TaxID=4170 RepID=A0A5A7QUG3_STRAF|nr:H(+)-ATPase 2 [Striga asiatica]